MTTSTTTDTKSSTLISADRVEGTAVFNAKGEKLGHVEDVMLHKLSGKVAYAVISCGGFLGVGEKYHPIPWSLLTYDVDKGGYVLPVEPRQLEEARSFAADDLSDDDSEWRREVHNYYNAPAYWM